MEILFATHNNRRQTFITWERFTLQYMRQIFKDKGFKKEYYE